MGLETPRDLLAHIPRDYKDWREPRPIAAIAADALRSKEPTEEIAVARDRERARRSRAISDYERRATRRERVAARDVVRPARPRREDPPGSASSYTDASLPNAGAARSTIEINVMRTACSTSEATFRARSCRSIPPTKDVADADDPVDDLTEPSTAARKRSKSASRTSIVRTHRLITARKAWHDVHAPHDPERRRPGAPPHHLRGVLRHRARRGARSAPSASAKEARSLSQRRRNCFERFEESLPFRLTGAQQRVIAEILRRHARAARDEPPAARRRRQRQDARRGGRDRRAASAGVQSALMAPTEILAAQHAQKLAPLLLPFGVAVEASSAARCRAPARRRANDRIAAAARPCSRSGRTRC